MRGKAKAAGLGDLVRLVEGYRAASVLMASCALGVFDALDEGVDSADAAVRLGTDPRATEVLLDALASLGFVHKRGRSYSNARVSREHLRGDSARGVLSNLRYQQLLAPGWARLPEIIRQGSPAASLGRLLQADPEFRREYILGMRDISAEPARELAASLGLAGTRAALDVGGGPGVYAEAFAKAEKRLNVTLLDLPPVLDLARESLAESPWRDRVWFEGGDYRRASFGRDRFDLVLLSHVTHDESEAENRRLIRKAAGALRGGGRLVIHDFMLDRDRTAPRFGALFSVHMLVYTRDGRAYAADEYRSWLRGAGLRDLRTLDVCAGTPNATRAVVGRKR